MVAKKFRDQQRLIDDQNSKIINVKDVLINYNYLMTNFEWLYSIDFYSLILELSNVKIPQNTKIYLLISLFIVMYFNFENIFSIII